MCIRGYRFKTGTTADARAYLRAVVWTDACGCAGIRRRFLPTSLDELRDHEAAQDRQPLASQEHTAGDEAV